ncbi:MAG TPA: hypothetical protein VEL11_01640 [Candidatus Bathyarchaeia archaeon]|nr:hypothetical protein [Candidatus Bathyarchaeia archaeon]
MKRNGNQRKNGKNVEKRHPREWVYLLIGSALGNIERKVVVEVSIP